MRRHLPLVLLAACVSCGAPPATTTKTASSGTTTDFEKLTDDLLYGSLALSPVSATQTGYHEHNGMKLDEMLDNYSASGIDGQRRFYEGIQTRIAALNAPSLDK